MNYLPPFDPKTAAYAYQLREWLEAPAHALAARVWWGELLEQDAEDELLTIALRMALKAKTAKLFDWRATATWMMSDAMRQHSNLHSDSFKAMKAAAAQALKSGLTRQAAAQVVINVAKSRSCPPPAYLIADAVEFAEKDIFFENLRAQSRVNRRKSKARAR